MTAARRTLSTLTPKGVVIPKFEVGARVRLTPEFLRNTGQIAGGEAFSVWTVVACPCRLCAGGRFVATSEESFEFPGKPRHIHAGNLERKRS